MGDVRGGKKDCSLEVKGKKIKFAPAFYNTLLVQCT